MQIVRKQYQRQYIHTWIGDKWVKITYSKKRNSPHKRFIQRLKGMRAQGFEFTIRRKPKEKFILVEDKRWIA